MAGDGPQGWIGRGVITYGNQLHGGKIPAILKESGYPSIEKWPGQVEIQPYFIPLKEDGAVYVATFKEYFDKNA
ncbi:MAG TPA: hypothetical protein VIC02_05855 [Kineobactrum sp.]